MIRRRRMEPEAGSPIFELSNDGLGTIRLAPADASVLVDYLMNNIRLYTRHTPVRARVAWDINRMSRMVYELVSSPNPILTSLSNEDTEILKELSNRTELNFIHKIVDTLKLRSCPYADPVTSDSAGKTISSVMES